MKVSQATLGFTALFLQSQLPHVFAGNKEIVFIAGPHQAEANTAAKLFANHALQGDVTSISRSGSTSDSTGLDGWLWPQVDEDLPGDHYEVFENFFWNADNDTMQELLLDSIETSWKSATHGIVIAADGFDETLGDPESLGLQTITKIVQRLKVTAEHVHLVFLYRSPRVEQWVSLFQHHRETSESYQEFICQNEYVAHLVNKPMNPLMLSEVYLSQGYQVVAIDSVGVEANDMDIGHVVACEVLSKTTCTNGQVQNVAATYETTEEQGFSSSLATFSQTQRNELEHMFIERDCFYKKSLENNDNFRILYQDSLWENCSSKDADLERYEVLANPPALYEAIRGFVDCSAEAESEKKGPSRSELFLYVAIALFVLYNIYDCVFRYIRREPDYMKSPKTCRTVWVDFGEEAFAETSNLRNSNDEDSLSDVDLFSPTSGSIGGSNSPREYEPASDPTSDKEKSYRVGTYRKSPTTEPIKGDSAFEFSIKSLEKEIS
eukprot:Nitzschia sp. Nitz4//scaffold63_size106090//51014//52492//NITZ4_004392-RA/size106090-processed-gene-0.142-mRNA-1//-1//CDS//3329555981//7683//frame0